LRKIGALFAIVLALGTGCATSFHSQQASPYAQKTAPGTVLRSLTLDPALEDRILALDPERITADDVRNTLAAGPTPRIVGLHGGIYPVHLAMESFAEFLVGMGYPEDKLRHPGDGRLSHSPYENSEHIAGLVAWYYEKEGTRPMLVGHSQGGIQAVKVLYEFAGAFTDRIPVWNPLTDQAEDRFTIIDPVTGLERPVVGLRLGYVSVVGAGGVALLLPNQWRMAGRLRTVPDTVDEFTGYWIGVDLFAWDFGFAAVSGYRGEKGVKIRNVRLPAYYSHVVAPVTAYIAKDARLREWIDAYHPGMLNGFATLPEGPNDNLLWAADVWYEVKKHWCLEAQRLIRAKRAALGPK
jgi:hypothetical protein